MTRPRTRRAPRHWRGELGEVDSCDRPVRALDEERDVEDADETAVHEVQQKWHHLAGDRRVAGPLEDDVVDRAHLYELLVNAHCVSLSDDGVACASCPARGLHGKDAPT